MYHHGGYKKILVGKLEEKPLERHRRRWEDKMKTNLKEIWYERCGLDSCVSRQGLVARSYEHDNELSVPFKDGEFLYQPSNCQLL
jgi:hypothetical protein